MIKYLQGNLLDSDAEAFVNSVNTVGVMGKGIALAFKNRFPANYYAYRTFCVEHGLVPGQIFVTETGATGGSPGEPRWIVNFATKQHWRDLSRLGWITTGLEDMREFIILRQVESIAIPALGVTMGGLAWPDVRNEIEKHLHHLDCDIRVYEPPNA